MKSLPLSEPRYCPDCGARMEGPTCKARWACPSSPKKCGLISCKFDKFGKNPYDIKREGLTPITGFGGIPLSPIYLEEGPLFGELEGR